MNKYDYDVLISIDIGYTGGISFFDMVSGELLSLYPMPILNVPNAKGKLHKILDIEALLHIMKIPFIHNDNALVVYEGVHAFPFQGVVSVASLMEQKGIIRGMAKGLGYAELPIQPKLWQKFFDMIPPDDLKGKTTAKTKTLRKEWIKQKSLELARSKFKGCATKLEPKTAHGLSDSLLIGQYIIELPPEL